MLSKFQYSRVALRYLRFKCNSNEAAPLGLQPNTIWLGFFFFFLPFSLLLLNGTKESTSCVIENDGLGIIFAHTAHSVSRSYLWYHRHFKQPEGSEAGALPSGKWRYTPGCSPGSHADETHFLRQFCGRACLSFIRTNSPNANVAPKADKQGRSCTRAFEF